MKFLIALIMGVLAWGAIAWGFPEIHYGLFSSGWRRDILIVALGVTIANTITIFELTVQE